MNTIKKYSYVAGICFFLSHLGCKTVHRQELGNIDPNQCIPWATIDPNIEKPIGSRAKILAFAQEGFQGTSTINNFNQPTINRIIRFYVKQQLPLKEEGFPVIQFGLFPEDDCRLEAEARTPNSTWQKTHLVWKKDLPFTQAEKEAAPGTDLFIGPPSQPQPSATDPMTGIYERKIISNP